MFIFSLALHRGLIYVGGVFKQLLLPFGNLVGVQFELLA
jgi:hypothetical protein